MITTINLRWYK